MGWPEFYFARHGETDWNRQRRYQGSRDIPLNATGQGQADANGPLLKDLLQRNGHDPRQFAWFASPLSRAAETMQRMRAAFDVELPDLRYDDRLKEISFGELEGRLHNELPPEMAIPPGERNEDYWDFRPKNGENYQDVADRLNEFAAELPGPAIIVAHGGILRVLRHIVEGADKKSVLNYHPPQGTVAWFKNGGMQMFESELANTF